VEAVSAEGADGLYRGSIGEVLVALSDERGGRISRADLASYEARWSEPVSLSYAGTTFLTRGGLSAVPLLLGRLPALRGLDETARVRALVGAFDVPAPDGHTTNLVVV